MSNYPTDNDMFDACGACGFRHADDDTACDLYRDNVYGEQVDRLAEVLAQRVSPIGSTMQRDALRVTLRTVWDDVHGIGIVAESDRDADLPTVWQYPDHGTAHDIADNLAWERTEARRDLVTVATLGRRVGGEWILGRYADVIDPAFGEWSDDVITEYAARMFQADADTFDAWHAEHVGNGSHSVEARVLWSNLGEPVGIVGTFGAAHADALAADMLAEWVASDEFADVHKLADGAFTEQDASDDPRLPRGYHAWRVAIRYRSTITVAVDILADFGTMEAFGENPAADDPTVSTARRDIPVQRVTILRDGTFADIDGAFTVALADYTPEEWATIRESSDPWTTARYLAKQLADLD